MPILKDLINRWDTYAVGSAEYGDPRYRRVASQLTEKLINDHLTGTAIIGVYTLSADSQSRTICFDFDDLDPLPVANLVDVIELIAPGTALVEKTGGRGWHVWLVLREPLDGGTLRGAAKVLLDQSGLPESTEIYPRQAAIAEGGFGNLVKLPGGTHPRTGEVGHLYVAAIEGDPVKLTSLESDLGIDYFPLRLLDELSREWHVSPDTISRGRSRTLPCMQAIQQGVPKGMRDEAAFRYAAWRHMQGDGVEVILAALREINRHFKPPLEDNVLIEKVKSGATGKYGLPCKVELLQPLCSPDCPMYASRFGLVPDAGIIAQGDCLWAKKKGKRTLLAEFTVTVDAILRAGDEDILRVRLRTPKGDQLSMDVPKSAFNSKQRLLSWLPRASLVWHGSDNDTARLLSYLAQQDAPTIQATNYLGMLDDGGSWVFPDVSYGGGCEYVRPMGAPYLHLSGRRWEGDEKQLKAHLRWLMKINTPRVVIPIIGWTMACLFKPLVVRRLGHFPLLCLHGTRGSGKTQLVQRGILPLFGYTEPQAFSADATRFAAAARGSLTNSIPILVDDFRTTIDQTRLEEIYELWRHAYSGGLVIRGRANLTISMYRQRSPLIITGEELPADAALQERMVSVLMSPHFLTPTRQEAFTSFVARPVGGVLVELLLPYTDQFLSMIRQPPTLPSWVPPRIRNNLGIVAAGVQLFNKATGVNLSEDPVDWGPLRYTDAVAQPVDYSAAMSFLEFAVAHLDYPSTTWGDTMKRDGKTLARINMGAAYADYAGWSGRRGRRPMMEQAVRRELMEMVVQKNIVVGFSRAYVAGGPRRRVVLVDIDALQRAERVAEMRLAASLGITLDDDEEDEE